jgi:hypothetical protein
MGKPSDILKLYPDSARSQAAADENRHVLNLSQAAGILPASAVACS